MKESVKNFVSKVGKSRISGIFKILLDVVMCVEYLFVRAVWIFYKKPSPQEHALMREKVTFIYKSFERQNNAKRLFRNIQRYYPGIKVIIADDSAKPLDIQNRYAHVIQLPFNSGLSYGIGLALEQVKTPFVIRLDDDELLTPHTRFEKQLQFLLQHEEVDLVGILCCRAPLCIGPKKEIKKYYAQPMNRAPLPLKIPHMTRIDSTHIVLGKTPNAFIARTEKIKEIGYDKNIRMIDHNEFFYRAAGRLVSAVDETASIFHYHNQFDRHYNKYRNDTRADGIYIRKKHAKAK